MNLKIFWGVALLGLAVFVVPASFADRAVPLPPLGNPAPAEYDAVNAVYLKYVQSAKGYREVFIVSRGRAVKATVRQSSTGFDGKPVSSDHVESVPAGGQIDLGADRPETGQLGPHYTFEIVGAEFVN